MEGIGGCLLSAGSRATLYIASDDPLLFPGLPSESSSVDNPAGSAETENAQSDFQPFTSGGDLAEGEMSRVTFEKKMSNPDRRRPPIYRPKSRTDTGRTSSRPDTSRLRSDIGSSDEDLARQNTDLRQRLQDEAGLYRRKLDTYRQAQQNQATLVSRLQAKVLQYKQRCSELETQRLDLHHDHPPFEHVHHVPRPHVVPLSASTTSSALEQAQQHLREIREERITDLDTALRKLDEERSKCEKMMQLNASIRDQLEESRKTNENLTGDLQKLTNDFEELREEMILKEDEWKDEEQAFNDYYSTEHNRLLNLWRDVVGIKRLFMDVQSTTEKDLTKLKMEIGNMGREASIAVGRLDRNTSMESLFGIPSPYKVPSFDHESMELKAQLDLLRSQNETSQHELRMKEDKIQQLLKDFQTLEDRCAAAEHNVSQSMRVQEDVDILHGALRDIAHALIQDADTKEPELTSGTHVHLSASTQAIQRSPKRGRPNVSPAAFAESTISAVQAALHKYQSLIHELQVKLQGSKEQLMLVRKQHEHSDDNVNTLEQRVKELVAQLDASRAQMSHCSQERDSLHKALESFKMENFALDKHRVEINCMVEGLNADYEKLQKETHRLQKELDMLHEEKIFLQTEVDRLNQNADHREMNLRSEEERCSRMREELLMVREELNKLYLNHDLLEQQKIEAEELIANLERSKSETEQHLDKVLGERSNVSDSLAKKENAAANLEQDKKKLQDDIKKLEEDRLALQTQCNDHLNDLQSLRKELLQAEQQKLDLESEKVTLTEKTKFLEIEKGKIEMELGQVIRERSDLANQLTVVGRKKDALNEELMRTRQKLEQASETNSRINRNLEELVKECEEKQCAMDALDKDLQRLAEQLAAVRCEKEALEGVLFDTQTNLESTENKKFQLEKDQQELLIKQEALKGQVVRLTKDLERSEKRCIDIKNTLSQQAGNQEAEFTETIINLKKLNEDNVRKLTDEREKIRASLEKRLQQTLQQLTHEKDSEIEKLLERIDGLQNHIDNVCQQHEELMLRAENDKQQALLLAHHDHQALHERLEATKRELEAERENLERLKRESNGQYEADRASINQLKEELNKHKAKLDECKTKCEEDKCRLEHRIDEIRNERDQAQSELENVKVQLHLSEDKVDDLHNQLHETIRKLKEAENNSESLRKDLTDIRRQLNDCNIEKEKYHTSNKELREFVKRTEQEKREIGRQLEESIQKISSMEELKTTIEAEKTRLLDQIRDIEKDQLSSEHKIQSLQEDLQRQQSAGSQAQAEEKELQARLLNEVEERERAHQEVHNFKKQVSELERNLDQTRTELSRTRSHSAHHEEQWHAREQDLLVHLEDSRTREKKLEDQKHNLEVCLVDATQQIQELKARLSGSEGRVKALDAQLAQLEGSKRDVEQKLHSVVSTLRRIAGIQLDGSITAPYRLMSPSRRWSPARGSSQEHDGAVDVDPEVIRKGVRNLMQQVAQVERERDDMRTQISSVKKQLQEAHDVQNKGDNKVTKLMTNLRSLQDEKGSLEIKLGQKSKAFQAQSEAFQKKCEESQHQRDKIVSLELTISSSNEEKLQLEDKLEKIKNQLNRLENDKRSLQEELSRTENRSTKLELQRMSAEGDLQRLQMMLQEKDAQIQKLQEKSDGQARIVASLEERCVSLKSTIDQMTMALDKASANEAELKSELQGLHRSLMESSTASHSGAERLKHLQKSLANCENEKRVITERMDGCQQSVAELRRNNQILQDQIARLNNELSNCEVQKSGLESQLRMSQWPADSPSTGHQDEDILRQLQSTQRERSELKGKVDSMSHKLRQMETEKRNLERSLAKGATQPSRQKTYERPEKYELEKSDTTDPRDPRLEQENRELRMKIQKLENELTDKETELARIKTQRPTTILDTKFDRSEIERYRAAQLQAERLLEAREQSHRQQVARLEHQVATLREQLNQEIKRRQQYVLRSTRAGREMQQLRQALGDSLRTVSQDPSLDALLLEHEARKLDNTLTTTASLPPGLSSYDRRATTPQPHK